MSGREQNPGQAPTPAGPVDVAVFDIDGVLADSTHRLHHIRRDPPDWDTFYDACDRDGALEPGVSLARTVGARLPVLYLTGRIDRVRGITESWLRRHQLPNPHALIMRGDRDRTAAGELKVAQLERAAHRFRPVLIVDDTPAVVDALLAAGHPAVQATWRPEEPADIAGALARSLDPPRKGQPPRRRDREHAPDTGPGQGPRAFDAARRVRA